MLTLLCLPMYLFFAGITYGLFNSLDKNNSDDSLFWVSAFWPAIWLCVAFLAVIFIPAWAGSKLSSLVVKIFDK